MNKPTGKENGLTMEHRYLAALDQIQKAGVLVFDNYPSCCGSCSSFEIEQAHGDADHIFFHNSQGRKLIFKDGKPYNEEESFDDDEDDEDSISVPFTRLATKLYWSHSSLRAANVTAVAFKDNGFTVDWDGTDSRCVIVVFYED